jgi:hypothetical protein
MANTTFSGPVRSLNGFISFGPKAVVSLTANTTLTVASHAGRVLTCNDADGVFTLPTILASSASAVAGANDYNVLSNLGATFTFLVETAATDMDIKTDGTDKFYGAVYTGIDDSAGGKTFISDESSNDVITMNGSTKGGLAGSVVQITAIANDAYYVTGQLLGSSTLVTPFADS